MITVKLKSKNELYVGQLPESWQELTTEQYIAIEADTQPLELFSILTNIPLDVVENANLSSEQAGKYTEKIATFYNNPPDLEKLPKQKIEGVSLPKRLDMQTFGQKVILEEAIKSVEDMRKIIPDAIAIYLQPAVENTFDSKRVPVYKQKVLQMPIMKTYPWASFFFSSLIDYKVRMQLAWQR